MILQTLLTQIIWYYDHFLTHNNVDAQRLLMHGPDKAEHLGERTMRHRALLELEASEAARAKRQAEFDAKYGPQAKASRAVTVHSTAPLKQTQVLAQKSQTELEEERLHNESERQRSVAIESQFARARISPKGITSFKRLLLAVTPLGWVEKMGGNGGHRRFEREFKTAGGYGYLSLIHI